MCTKSDIVRMFMRRDDVYGSNDAEKPVNASGETTDDASHPFADDVMMKQEEPKRNR